MALIPVLWFVGWLLAAIGVGGVATAWVVFAIAAVWMGAVTWWALLAPVPPQLTDEARGRYFSVLRQGRYRPFEHENDTERAEVGHRP